LTEYTKNLIEEFGFIPMGSIKLPDGRNSGEISYQKQDKNWVSSVYDKSSRSKIFGIEKGGLKNKKKSIWNWLKTILIKIRWDLYKIPQ